MKIKSNVTTLMVKGVNLNRIFKDLQKNDIKLMEIDRKDYKTVKFDVESKNVKKVFAILNKPCYNINVEKSYGISALLGFLKNRIGIIVSIFVFLSLLALNSFFVCNIKVYGCENIDKQSVVNILKDNGVYTGALINNVNIDKCEQILTDNLDEISLVSVIKNGNSIIVNIKEKPFDINKVNSSENDIVANFNGTITEISVVEGTAKVKVGDSFKAGDILIAGYNINQNGTKSECKANGKIKAKIWFSHSETFLTECYEMVRTGNKITKSEFYLLGLKINETKKDVAFENYEIEQSECEVFNNNFIPFKKVTTIYHETKSELVTKSFEENKDKILESCYEKAKMEVPDHLEITNIFDMIQEIDKGYVVSAYYEVETYL